MGDRDILFMTKNCFYTGAFNNAINEASDLEGLTEAEQIEKDAFVYRSYIALGSHDVSTSNSKRFGGQSPGCGPRPVAVAWAVVALPHAGSMRRPATPSASLLPAAPPQLVISEIKDDAAMALQAIKLLAQYKGGRVSSDAALATVASWQEDAACNPNPYVLLVAGTIYATEGDYVEALKACHSGALLEM